MDIILTAFSCFSSGGGDHRGGEQRSPESAAERDSQSGLQLLLLPLCVFLSVALRHDDAHQLVQVKTGSNQVSAVIDGLDMDTF